MKVKKLILKYYKKEKKLLVIFIIFNLLVTLLDLSAPLVVKKIIDTAIPNKNLNMISYLSFMVLAMYGARTAFAIVSFSRGQLMGNRIKFHMRNDLFSHMLKQSTEFFNKKEKGELIARITSDLENSSSLLYRGLQDSISAGGAIIGSFFLMLFFSPILTLIIFAPFPFGFLFVHSKNRKLKSGYKEIRKNNSNFTSTTYELFRVIFFLKDNVLENYAEHKFKESNNNLLMAEKRNYLNVGIFMSGVTFYVHLTQIILIGFGGYLFTQNKITIGIIISFLLLVDRFKISLIKLAGLTDTYQKGMSGINRLNSMLNTDYTLLNGTKNITSPFEVLTFKNVSFSYGNENILNNLSFSIRAKEKIAIVGKSGIGKSTVLNLIKKNYLPDSGDIFINNINYKDINKDNLLNLMGILNNSENILYETVEKNISIVKNKSTYENIVEACKQAYIDETIEKLPKKYKSIMGNKGTILSTGQNQRISFARLFLKKPEIILLDEATSGLDRISEKIIINNILNFLKEKTVIFVTHRLDIIKNFDRILVFNENGIVEDDNFEKLIEKRGEFYSLYKKNNIKEN